MTKKKKPLQQERIVKECTLLIKVDERRCPLITVFAKMPDEAFSWLLKLPLTEFPALARNGGFLPESRKAFKEVAAAANEYV